MLFTYIQGVKTKTQAKKHHLQDEKYKEKIKRPIRSC